MTRPSGIWHNVSCDETRASPQIDEADEDSDFHVEPMTVTGEILSEAIYMQDQLHWTRFDYADERAGMIARVMRRRS